MYSKLHFDPKRPGGGVSHVTENACCYLAHNIACPVGPMTVLPILTLFYPGIRRRLRAMI